MTQLVKSQKQGRQIYPYLYLIPGLAAILFSIIVPGFMTIYYSFTNYSLRHLQDWGWIGLENYAKIFIGSNRGEFLSVFSWNIEWALISTIGTALVEIGRAHV
mgnify:FL=1